MKQIKCPVCNEKFTKLEGLHDHIDEDHSDLIPEGFTPQQYVYYTKTGKTHGNCVMCKTETEWNETTGKYKRFCDNPKCKEEYREIFKKRMVGKYGKTTLLNDPEQQKKMLANRHISGEYEWTDGSIKTYTGSYELDFLKFLDVFMNMDSDDVITPSPHTYYYKYEGETKFYIPDVYIPSLNLEIEIKDGGNNPNMHHKIVEVDKVKERLKDDVMKSQKEIDYIKIVDKKYDDFFDYLMKKKDELAGAKNVKISSLMTESFSNIVNDYDESVTEGIAIDKELYYNFDKLESGKSNIILVTGLSGSGKSTLAKSLASKYNAEYIELDMFDPHSGVTNKSLESIENNSHAHRFIYDFLKAHPSIHNKFMSPDITDTDIAYANDDFLKYCISTAKKDSKKNYVIEGIQIYEYMSYYDKTFDCPMVIKMTPALQSYIRVTKRENWKLIDIIRNAPAQINRRNKAMKQIHKINKKMITEGAIDYKAAAKSAEITISDELNNILYSAATGHNIYLATDWHLWIYDDETSTIIRNERTKDIINTYNNIVNDDDVFIYLGDLCDDEFQDKESLQSLLLELRPNTKILCKGNNDIFSDEFYKSCGFTHVTYKFMWEDILFSHFPLDHDYKANIHGHIHGCMTYKCKYNSHIDVYTTNGRPLPILDVLKSLPAYGKRITEVLEEKYIETSISDPFKKSITLYHGSHNPDKLSKISPLSKNMGTRFSNMRMSSFWTPDEDYAKDMAICKYISDKGYHCVFDHDFNFLIYNDKDKNPLSVYKDISNGHIWVYVKNMQTEHIGRGHFPGEPSEYSIDVDVVPDEAIKVELKDIKNYIINKIRFMDIDFNSPEGKKYIEDDRKYWYRRRSVMDLIIYPSLDEYTKRNRELKYLKKPTTENRWLTFEELESYEASYDNIEIEFIEEDNNMIDEAWSDIKNGVNPKSKKRLFHVSRSSDLDGKVLTPRVPGYLASTKFSKDDPYYEEMKTPRVCFSASINGCLNAMINGKDHIALGNDELYVYIPEKPISEYKIKTNKNIIKDKDVFDANTTGEVWVLEPVKLRLYGTIKVDQVSRHHIKHTVNKNGKLAKRTYKWHWQVRPNVIKGMTKDDPDYYTNKESYEPVIESISLSGFKKIPVNESNVNKYKDSSSMSIGLKHLRTGESVKGFMWIDKDDTVVAYIATDTKDEGIYIIALETAKKYQGNGIGSQLLNIATRELNAKYLSVNKKNTSAYDLYKKSGWNVFRETEHMYFMTIDKYVKESYEPVLEVSNIAKDNDNYYDFERFVNGDSNILLITGLEASNTTKVAREYSQIYDATYINFDLFTKSTINQILDGTYDGTANAWYINHIRSFAESRLVIDPDNRDHVLKPTDNDVIKFVKYIFKNLNDRTKYVIEGICFYRYKELSYITMEYPLIVKHDSLKSTIKNFKLSDKLNLFNIAYDEISSSKDIKDWFNTERNKLNNFSQRTLDYRSRVENMHYKKDKYPVYVVLMHSGSALASAIKKVTGDEFSHASISFDPSLRNMYSFGQKYDSDILELGMIREDVHSAFLHRPIDFALYVTFVTADEFKAMKAKFYEIVKREKELRYSFAGLIKYAIGVDAETKNKMFCSEFVANVLNSKYNNTDGYYASQVKPEDFKNFDNFRLVQKGKLSEYDPSVTIARVNKMKK